MSRTRYKIVDNNYPYLLTATVVEWLSLLSKHEVVKLILDSMQYMQNNERMKIYSYVVMTNHLRMISYAENLSKEFEDFKSYTAR